MKKSKKLIIAIMVITMLFTTLAPLAVSAAAPKPLPTDKIYYFYDFYPTVDEETLNSEFDSNCDIIYCHTTEGAFGFEQLVSQVSTDSNGGKCIVIIDIKTFLPECSDLFGFPI